VDSVAVLPIVNATGDPNAEYLSEGITQDLVSILSQLPNLKVVSLASAYRYKARPLIHLRLPVNLASTPFSPAACCNEVTISPLAPNLWMPCMTASCGASNTSGSWPMCRAFRRRSRRTLPKT